MEKRKLMVLLVSVCMVLVLVALSLTTGCSTAAPAGETPISVDIAGGSIGGSTNLIANACAGVLDKYLGIKKTTVLTYSTLTIAPAVAAGEVHMGVSNSAMSWDPFHGTGTWQGKQALTGLREIMPTSASPIQIYVPLDSPIKTFRDLVGKRISPGTKGMGPEEILSKGCPAIGLNWEKDFKLEYMGHAEGGSSLVAGKLDAYLSTGTPPHPTLSETDLTRPLRLIGFTEADASAIAKGVPGVVGVTIPQKYYHMDKPVITVGHVGHALAMSDFSEDVVYGLIKNTIEQPEFVGYFSGAFKGFVTDKDMGLQFWSLGWPSHTDIPLHKAALRYYQEIGWNVPAGRIPPEAK